MEKKIIPMKPWRWILGALALLIPLYVSSPIWVDWLTKNNGKDPVKYQYITPPEELRGTGDRKETILFRKRGLDCTWVDTVWKHGIGCADIGPQSLGPQGKDIFRATPRSGGTIEFCPKEERKPPFNPSDL